MKHRIILLLCLFSSATGFCQEATRSAEDVASRRARILKDFPESDTNGDGVLSARELAALREKQLSTPKMQARLKAMLRRFPGADANKDGILSQEEFRSFQASRRKSETPRSRRNNVPRIVAPVPDVAYDDHELQRFDLWPVPDAENPTPLVIFIHGGGFRSGDKSLVPPGIVETYRKAGVAFAAMNYRLSDSGPYPIMMHDAARGLQTIRHRAEQWNIDPDRIVCYGGSAGAGISLWLAFHDDLADPDSSDPVARQSTRILAAGAMNGQSTYDMHTFREWFSVPDLAMGPALPAFLGIEGEADLDKPAVKARMQDASPIAHLTDDDCASVYMMYSRPNTTVTRDSESAIWVHHVLLGMKLREAMKSFGLECVVTAPDLPKEADPYGSLEAFLIAKATGESDRQ